MEFNPNPIRKPRVSVLLGGNLIEDPIIKKDNRGNCICEFSIETKTILENKQGKEYLKDVSYFDIITTGKLAKRCHEFLKKGMELQFPGTLKQLLWKTEQGENRSKIYIACDQVERKCFKLQVGNRQPDYYWIGYD